MDERRHERRQFFRGKLRPGRVMPIRFCSQTSETWIDAETRNIGVGGAYVTTPHVAEVGSALAVEVKLPTSDRVFTLLAIVRWASAAQPAGMGIQFMDTDSEILVELNDYFATFKT